MVTTVVTTTAVSSVAVTAGAALGIVAVLTLIIALIAKELGSAEEEAGRASPRLQFFLKAVNVPIVSLLAVFAVIVATKVMEVL